MKRLCIFKHKPNHMLLDDIIQSIYPIPEASLQKLKEKTELICCSKGQHLFEAGKKGYDWYFIQKGIARAYCYSDDIEVTFWFGREGDAVFSYNSYIHDKKGYEHVELLEDAWLYHLKTDDLQYLFENDIDLANWGRKLAETELVKMEQRFISRLFKPAKQRYHELIENDPQLLQRVQLGHIASYLGITQVSLSRIRAGKG